MRLYAKLWNKRLRQNTIFDEREKGFMLVDGCFEKRRDIKADDQAAKEEEKGIQYGIHRFSKNV